MGHLTNSSGRDRLYAAEFEKPLGQPYFLMKYLVMAYLHYALVNLIITEVDGQWRHLPFLNLFGHPHLDFYRSFEELCKQEGFDVETHWVTTEDGYINKLYRVNNFNETVTVPRPAVLLVHGLIDSSDTWVINGRNNSHAFILVDEGYDVWLANTRGNKYSRTHKTLDAETDVEYWNQGHALAIAKYDLPAFIEHVKAESKVSSIAYIGHSQGAQEMFYSLATNATYFEKNINLVVALGPMISAKINTRLNRAQMYLYRAMEPYVERFSIFQSNNHWTTNFLGGFGCAYNPYACSLGLRFIATTTNEYSDWERRKVFFGADHYPAGSSIRCWHHLYQQDKMGALHEFDWGPEKNQRLYGSEDAPKVDISGIKNTSVPIVMVAAQHDLIVEAAVSAAARDTLGKAVVEYLEIGGGHLDFMVGKDQTWFKENVMKQMKRYN